MNTKCVMVAKCDVAANRKTWSISWAGGASFARLRVKHASGAPAYALRVEYGGKVITYSGDTEWTESLVEAARGADLFVCEAYFFVKKVKYHLDY